MNQIAPAPDDLGWRNLYQIGRLGGFNPIAAIVDPGNNLNGVPTLGTDGLLTIPVKGGWSAAGVSSATGTWDPGTDGIYLVWPIYHRRGRRVTGDCNAEIPMRVRAPALVAADNVMVGIGVISEPTLLGNTVRGVLGVYDCSATVGPRARAEAITAGVATKNATDGTLSTLARGLETRFSKGGKGGGATAGFIHGLRNSLIDSTGVIIASTGANPTVGVGSPGIGDAYGVAAICSTNAANAARSVGIYVEVGDISMTVYG